MDVSSTGHNAPGHFAHKMFLVVVVIAQSPTCIGFGWIDCS